MTEQPSSVQAKVEEVRIENWSCDRAGDNYTAPEMAGVAVVGDVYGSHRPDGKTIKTSAIVSVDGRRVHTAGGSVYTLGAPHPEYVEWCRAAGVHVPTDECPIKLVKRLAIPGANPQ